MKFGIQEMQAFARESDDERVKAMWTKIQQSRSNAAKWNARCNELEHEVKQQRQRLLRLESVLARVKSDASEWLRRISDV